ncbi:hypothetical protein Fcan01_15838 [Folsomia candida]|uniref:Uncharacterized protein n=1 Tax=Folsomia candida TaxID=158441 RepID=A0A226DXG2_FOLCA|nr:hypothetical protein Fcan01_15838 [Folsomia candida]
MGREGNKFEFQQFWSYGERISRCPKLAGFMGAPMSSAWITSTSLGWILTAQMALKTALWPDNMTLCAFTMVPSFVRNLTSVPISPSNIARDSVLWDDFQLATPGVTNFNGSYNVNTSFTVMDRSGIW